MQLSIPGKSKGGKPEPDIFLEAAHALGVSPELCVGVEDAVAGVRAINVPGCSPSVSGSLNCSSKPTSSIKTALSSVPSQSGN
ncbi:MAG: HAD-IA family hydrolase [Spirochaetaceae bacterium]|nr:HAD-IA family hydrolase [Spirochaetaceae bacterium]